MVASEREATSCNRKTPAWNDRRVRELQKMLERETADVIESYISEIDGKLPSKSKWPGFRKAAWAACCERFDTDLLDLFVSKGLGMATASRQGYPLIGGNDLLGFLYRPDLSGNPAIVEAAKSYILHALALGLRFDGKPLEPVDVEHYIFPAFGEDLELYVALAEAGLSFKAKDEMRVDGEGDAEYLHYLLSCKSVSVMEFALNHGASIRGSSTEVNELWQKLAENPEALARLVKGVPAGAITPLERALPIVASSGDIEATRLVLGRLDDAAEPFFNEAIDLAASAGFTEIAALLLEEKALRFLRCSESAGLRSAEFEEALLAGALDSSCALVSAEQIQVEDALGFRASVVIPEGVLSVADKAFDGCRYGVSVRYPDSIKVLTYKSFPTFPGDISLPAAFADDFEYLFMKSGSKQMSVRVAGGVSRIMLCPTEKSNRLGVSVSGDTRDAVSATRVRGNPARRKDGSCTLYQKYVNNVDKLYADGILKHVRNKSRISVARLVDQSYLADEHKKMYAQWVVKNEKKWAEYFEAEGYELFSTLLPVALEKARGCW